MYKASDNRDRLPQILARLSITRRYLMERQDFNSGWIYHRNGDEVLSQAVTLPHDAMLHSPRSANSPGGSSGAFFEGGVYVYEKRFEAPEVWRDKSVSLEFGGVYRNTTVTLNGVELAFWPYGYTGFAVCLDAALRYGETNTLIVTADNSELPNSRWYSGGGIYRPVSLLLGGKNHIAWQGLRVTTKSIAPPAITVDTEIVGEGQVGVEIWDGDKLLTSAEGSHAEIALPGAALWSEYDSKLYTCRVTLHNENGVCDISEEQFGIRQISWSTQGLFINGRPTKLRGACIHHDNGVLGACSYPEAEERRVRKLKEQGFNAIRMAHNPAGRELLDACDRLGVYVMDEAFDMWYEHKNRCDYASDFAEWHERDLLAMAAKDYNHPSVILYSIGNEVSEPRDEKGQQLAAEMIELLHRADPSRPVTAGINLMLVYMASKGMGLYKEEDEPKTPQKPQEPSDASFGQKLSGSLFFNTLMQKFGAGTSGISRLRAVDKVTSPVLDMLDIAGYNYASGRYPMEKKQHPGRIVVGSETYPYEIAKNWRMVETLPYVIGDFMWTGWDYLGEAALGSWNTEGAVMGHVPYPWLLAEAGAFDITGYPGAEVYYAKTVWQHSLTPYIGVRPCNHPGKRLSAGMWRGTNAIDSWSWRGCEGNKVTVEVYSAAHSVELLLDGKSLGRKRTKDNQAIFHTVYTSGTLTALACDKRGRELGRSSLSSAGADIGVQIRPETEARAGKLLYVELLLTDDRGIVESNADRTLRIEATNAEILGFGSADPRPEVPFITGSAKTHYGRAQAVLRPLAGGELTITVIDENGARTETVLHVKK